MGRTQVLTCTEGSVQDLHRPKGQPAQDFPLAPGCEGGSRGLRAASESRGLSTRGRQMEKCEEKRPPKQAAGPQDGPTGTGPGPERPAAGHGGQAQEAKGGGGPAEKAAENGPAAREARGGHIFNHCSPASANRPPSRVLLDIQEKEGMLGVVEEDEVQTLSMKIGSSPGKLQ